MRPPTAADEQLLLRTVDLTRHFRLGGMFAKQILHAVDDFNMTIREREIVALVGESGSGKSTVARLHRPDLSAHPGGDLLPQPADPAPALPEGSARVPGGGGDGLPGSVQLVQPGVSGLPRGAAKPGAAPAGAESRRAEAGGGAGVRERGAERQDAPEIPVRDERGRAPAGRLRPGAWRCGRS